MNQVLRAIFELKQFAERPLFFAVSGGLDSMVLLHAAKRLGLSGTVLHVNHGLRGSESDGDEEFVRSESSRLGFEVGTLRIHWGSERASQNASRQKREEFFRAQVGERGLLFFAHHQDDQAETIFQRLLRGTGLDGLSAMKKKSGYKLRPFLDLPKTQLLLAAKEWDISWREDSSNASSKYERNWLRHEILPVLEKRRPGFSKRLCALAREAQEAPRSEKNISSCEAGDYLYLRIEKATVRDLKSLFSLSRLHATELAALLKKGNGKLSAKKKFWLSQGVLRVGKDFSMNSLSGAGDHFQSELGEWIGANMCTRRALGDSGKKLLQQRKIGVFFRDSIPFYRSEKGFVVLNPKNAEKLGISFQPSLLGQWFFNASQCLDVPVGEISKQKIQLERPHLN